MDARLKAGERTARLGILFNLLLMAAKLFAGLTSRSQSMISDALNSAGDVFASLAALLGTHAAAKPKDKDHPFGHGKAEFIASLAIALSMLAVAFTAGRSSVMSLVNRQSFTLSIMLVAVAAGTIVTKLCLYLYTRSIGKKYNSLLLIAASEDHRNDVLVTFGTLLGILASQAGLWWLDGAVGILIAFWIALTGIRILIASVKVLMDTSADAATEEHLRNDILEIPGVDHIDSITSLPVGARYIFIIRVSVPPDMTVVDGHNIAAQIRALLVGHSGVADAVVHINPDFPDGDHSDG